MSGGSTARSHPHRSSGERVSSAGPRAVTGVVSRPYQPSSTTLCRTSSTAAAKARNSASIIEFRAAFQAEPARAEEIHDPDKAQIAENSNRLLGFSEMPEFCGGMRRQRIRRLVNEIRAMVAGSRATSGAIKHFDFSRKMGAGFHSRGEPAPKIADHVIQFVGATESAPGSRRAQRIDVKVMSAGFTPAA